MIVGFISNFAITESKVNDVEHVMKRDGDMYYFGDIASASEMTLGDHHHNWT